MISVRIRHRFHSLMEQRALLWEWDENWLDQAMIIICISIVHTYLKASLSSCIKPREPHSKLDAFSCQSDRSMEQDETTGQTDVICAPRITSAVSGVARGCRGHNISCSYVSANDMLRRV